MMKNQGAEGDQQVVVTATMPGGASRIVGGARRTVDGTWTAWDTHEIAGDLHRSIVELLPTWCHNGPDGDWGMVRVYAGAPAKMGELLRGPESKWCYKRAWNWQGRESNDGQVLRKDDAWKNVAREEAQEDLARYLGVFD